MADTQIKFTVEGIQAVESAIRTIVKQADALTDTWITQGHIIIEDLQDEIRLLQQRNQLSNQGLGKGFEKNLKDANEIISQQIRLLRTRNEAARAGFRNEIPTQPSSISPAASGAGGAGDIGMRESVNSIADSLEFLLTEGIRIAPESIEGVIEGLRNLQDSRDARRSAGGRGASGRVIQESSQQPQSELGAAVRNFALMTAVRGVSASDPMQGALNMVSGIGSIASAFGPIGSVISAAITVATEALRRRYELLSEINPYATDAARLFNTSWTGEVQDLGNNLGANLGFNRMESMAQQASMQRATGAVWNRAQLRGNVRQSMEWQTRIGIDSESINSLARAMRAEDAGQRNINSLMASIFFGQLNGGNSQQQVTALIPELVRNISSMAESSQNATGYSNIETYTFLQNYLSNNRDFGTFFSRNPDLMRNVMGSLMNGLSSARTPQAEALQYMTLAQQNPGASFWQLQVARDVPNAQYLAGTLRNLQRVSGYSGNPEDQVGREMYARNLSEMFGLRASVADRFSRGQLSEEDLMREIERAGNPQAYAEQTADLMGGLSNTVSSLDAMLSEWKEVQMGQLKDVSAIVEGIRKLLGDSMERELKREENQRQRQERRLESYNNGGTGMGKFFDNLGRNYNETLI